MMIWLHRVNIWWTSVQSSYSRV